MRKFFKKAAAVLCITAMAAACFTGCGKKDDDSEKASNGKTESASSMFEVIKEASKVEQGTYEANITADTDGTKMELSISGEMDDKATSLSLDVNAGGMKFSFENVIVFTEDTLYINAAEIMDEAGVYLSTYMGSSDLSDFGITTDWVSFECEGAFVSDTSLADVFCDAMDKAYKDLITEDDSTFTIEVKDDKAFAKFTDATRALLENNKNEFADAIVKYYNSVDLSSMLNGFVDSFAEALGSSMGASEDEIDELKDELMGDTDLSEIEDLSKDDIVKSIEEMIAEMDSETATLDGSTMKITTSDKDGKYVTTIDGTASDEDVDTAFTIESIVKPDSTVSVTVPSKDDTTDLMDVLATVIALMQSAEDSSTSLY